MRCAEFNRDDVLQNAMETFRNKGYAKTTMQDLVVATGLHPGSLYGAFGNKRDLFLATVDHYVQEKNHLRREFFNAVDALNGLRHYLLRIVQDSRCGSCLLTRTLMEISEQDEAIHQRIKGIYGDLKTDLTDLLGRAIEQKSLSTACDVHTLTAFLLVSIQGLVTFAQCQPEPAQLDAVVAQIMRALEC